LTRTKIELDFERKILTLLITNTRFCQEVLPIIRSNYFKASFSKIIYKWVETFYSEFSAAPKQHIKDLYLNNKLSLQDDEEASDNISTLLQSLSKSYEETENINISFEITQCIAYLKVRSLEVLKDNIEDAIASNSPDKGEQFISNFKRVEKPTGQGIDLLHDHNKILDALTKEHSEIIKFPGAVGTIIQPISRGDFMSYFGPAKRGKSFWLWYTSEVAMSQGNKVIYIPLEMNDVSIIKRSWPSLTGEPLYNRTIHSAHFELDESTNKYKIEQDEIDMQGTDLNTIEDFQKKLRRLYRKGRIKIVPMVGATVNMIESLCDNLYYYENFVPDVIIIDYADYMEPGKKYTDNRDKINTIWKGLRDMANERNIAIITASHTEKKTFESDIKTSQASEDIRKINHVTLAVSLNATDKENENNIIRLGLMEVREGRHISDQAVCLQCLDLGRPCIDSRMKKEVIGYENKNEEKRGYKRKNVE
jgi:replicative DNA helicase